MNKKHDCNCGKPKCDDHCGISPAVLQINNPSECVLFHRVEVPASMGDSKTNPPKSGAYRNVLLYYEADQTSWLYSSDGVPQKLVNGITNYEAAINLPQINGVTLLGNKSLGDLGITDAIDDAVAEEKAEREAADEALGEEIDDINDELLSRAVVFDTVADMKAATNLVDGGYARTLGFHTINDGGGALYKITDTGTANEMDVIAVGNLYANLVIGNKVNAKQFGAYGDGTHDDVTAIQSAINYACAHNGVISFNSGRYNISDSLTLPSAIKIEGTYAKGDSTTSIKGTEILITSNNKSIFKLNSGVSYYQCEFRNLRLNATGTTGSKGFDTTDATFVSECIFDTIYFNGQFDIAFDAQKTTLTTIRNCMFSANNIAINVNSTFSGNYIENCNFWNNTQDVNATGTLENVYFDKCHFENTGNHTSMTFKAPVSLNSCAIRDCEYLETSSDYAILFDGTNTASFVRLTGVYIENTNITAKTGIKIDMTGNTANNNALADTFLNYVTFLRCTGYGVDTNYQNTRFILINCLCFNNWYYGTGTMTNQTTPNRIRTFSFKDGLDVDTSINFKYLNSLSYSPNSLYLNANDVLTWRFTDTSKTAPIAMIKLGSTANRPSSPLAGEMYYDWTVSKPIWWNGNQWIDATGTAV